MTQTMKFQFIFASVAKPEFLYVLHAFKWTKMGFH